jgi:quercetin dioxygenase-like cupin family protein
MSQISPSNMDRSAASYAFRLVESRLWQEGPRTSFLINSTDTIGQAALIEAVLTKADEPEPHIHPDTDETYYVMSGRLTFIIEDQTVQAPTGTTVFIGRGKRHTFLVGTGNASVLILLTPGGDHKQVTLFPQ